MEKIKIYVRVEGENKRHVFRVPPGITLDALLDRFGKELGINKYPKSSIQAAVFTPLGESLNSIEISDGAQILILINPLKDDITYEGIE